MESEHPEPVQTGGEGASAASDPARLIDRLIAAGDWPAPVVLEQIIAAGEAAVGPLLAFMQTYPDPEDHQREIALYHGIGILGAIRSPAAIPVLVEILRRYPEESGEEAARVLGEFGEAGFEPAMALVQDPDIVAYARQNAISAARHAAGTHPALRRRLGDFLRPMLADAIERTRELDRQNARTAEEADESPDDDDDLGVLETARDEALDDEGAELEPTGEDEEIGPRPRTREIEPYEELMFLIDDLAALADPEARDLIQTAFAEHLVDTFWIDEKSVEEDYREGGRKPPPPQEWLEDYRANYQRHQQISKHGPPTLPRPLRQAEDDEGPPPPPQEPIRNAGPKLGRNDPCWCGSGKKYKKCHWGKAGP